MPSDIDLLPAQPSRAFDPPAQRTAVRITSIYGTTWEPVEHLETSGSLTGYLRFGRLATYYNKAADQLPAVAAREMLEPAKLAFNRWTPAGHLVAARLWLFVLPSSQAVVALTLDVEDSPIDVIDLLEDLYYVDVKVNGVTLEDFACQLACRVGVTSAKKTGFTPERHQLVFSPELPEDKREDVIQKLIYRANLPYRPEFSAISYPTELNRRPSACVAVGPYVTVISGQQDYVENAAFVSAAQAVASAVRLREVRDMAYEDVRLFRDAQANMASLHSRRHTMECMANQLGNLELELSFSVESAADLGLLVPSLRVAGYHDALFHCMGLGDKADVIGRMLQRLERSISAEMTAIESVERRTDEDLRMRWTVAVGFLSTVALPVTLVLTFFGINAREVDGQQSMFNHQYLPMYIGVAVLVVLGLTLSAGLYLQQRWQAARDARRAAEAMVAVRSISFVRRRTPGSRGTGLPEAAAATSAGRLAPTGDSSR